MRRHRAAGGPARPIPGRDRPIAAHESTKALLRELGADPAYLEIKLQLGEVLTSKEREVLDAARGTPPPAEGGEL